MITLSNSQLLSHALVLLLSLTIAITTVSFTAAQQQQQQQQQAQSVAMRSFQLKPSMHQFMTTVAMDDVQCAFQFSTLQTISKDGVTCNRQPPRATTAREEQKAAKRKNEGRQYYDVLHRIVRDGSCVQKTIGYWTYKLCAGRDLVQYHRDDRYMLGKFNGVVDGQKAQEVLYDQGQTCPDGDIARSTRASYTCGPQHGIVEVGEPSTCTYRILVEHPDLCGEGSPFGNLNEKNAQRAAFMKPRNAQTEDVWAISIEKTSVMGRYLCTVRRILHDVKANPSVCFGWFALGTSPNSANAHGQRKSLKSVTARHWNRRQFAPDELLYSRSRDKVTTREDKFDGSLEYLRIELE